MDVAELYNAAVIGRPSVLTYNSARYRRQVLPKFLRVFVTKCRQRFYGVGDICRQM